MEILQLKYFQYVAKTENISHTAHIFMVPPSSVSVAIKKLEEELGFKLFDRSANSLKLNENGKILLRAIDASEKEFNKAKIDILNLLSTHSGEIKLLILTNRGRVTDAIAKFKSEYPNVTFSITHNGYFDFESYGKFDIVISDRNIDLDIFETRDFVREEIFLAVHKDSHMASQNSVKLKDIKESKFISMPKGSSIRDLLDSTFKKINLSPDIVIESEDPHFVCKYLKMGLGVALFPAVSWKKQVNEDIKLLKINDGIYRHSYMYVNKSSSNIVKVFASMLEIYSEDT